MKKAKILIVINSNLMEGDWQSPKQAAQAFALFIKNKWQKETESFVGVDIEITSIIDGDTEYEPGAYIIADNEQVAISIASELTEGDDLFDEFSETLVAIRMRKEELAPRYVPNITSLNTKQ